MVGGVDPLDRVPRINPVHRLCGIRRVRCLGGIHLFGSSRRFGWLNGIDHVVSIVLLAAVVGGSRRRHGTQYGPPRQSDAGEHDGRRHIPLHSESESQEKVKVLRVWVEQCFKLTRECRREGPMNYTKTAIAGTLDSASSEGRAGHLASAGAAS